MAGRRHATALASGAVPGAHLAAVSDPIAERCASFRVKSEADVRRLLSDPEVGAVVIATPHPSHAELSALALGAGRHVLVEKPVGVHKAECQRVLAVHEALGASAPRFAVVHDYRADPRFRWLKATLSAGSFGRVERIVWHATDWYRTEDYYRSSPWRGTFADEGGGLLVNQAPHLIDTLLWLFGMPIRAAGFCRFGRFHEIEVEDDVTAFLDFKSGQSAVIIAGTGEAPGTNRLDISCDRGRIVLEKSQITLHKNREAASAHRRREERGRPLCDLEVLEFSSPIATSLTLLQNFVASIDGRDEPLAPAREAARAVEVANAILWSSLLGKPLDLPIDGARFESVLADLSRDERKLRRPAGL
jgi:predicted dehydrogenase